MAVTIRAEIQGDHSTEVNLQLYKQMFTERLMSLEEGIFQLQIRRVHIARHKRQPGIYGVAYNTQANNSIEVLIFDSSPTGRPGIIYAPNEEMMEKLIEILAPKFYGSWKNTIKRTQDLGELSRVSRVDKLIQRAHTFDEAKQLKNLLSAHRKNVFDNRESIAYDIVRQLRWNLRIVSRVWIADIFGVPRDYPHLDQIILIAEQLGLVLFTKPDGSTEKIVEITDYAFDLANAWLERQNKKSVEEWQREHDSLQKKLTRAEEEETKYKRLLADASERKKLYSRNLQLHTKQEPKHQPFFKK